MFHVKHFLFYEYSHNVALSCKFLYFRNDQLYHHIQQRTSRSTDKIQYYIVHVNVTVDKKLQRFYKKRHENKSEIQPEKIVHPSPEHRQEKAKRHKHNNISDNVYIVCVCSAYREKAAYRLEWDKVYPLSCTNSFGCRIDYLFDNISNKTDELRRRKTLNAQKEKEIAKLTATIEVLADIYAWFVCLCFAAVVVLVFLGF